MGSDIVDDKARAVFGVEPDSIFDELDNVAAAYLLPWEGSGLPEGADEGIWGCAVTDHVASPCHNSLYGTAWVVGGDGMVR